MEPPSLVEGVSQGSQRRPVHRSEKRCYEKGRNIGKSIRFFQLGRVFDWLEGEKAQKRGAEKRGSGTMLTFVQYTRPLLGAGFWLFRLTAQHSASAVNIGLIGAQGSTGEKTQFPTQE